MWNLTNPDSTLIAFNVLNDDKSFVICDVNDAWTFAYGGQKFHYFHFLNISRNKIILHNFNR